MTKIVRRGLQVVALVGTLMVGIVAVALIVSQTPWFKDWLRRYIVRQSQQFVEGQLQIGRLGGNLFFGVQLDDVALEVDGERIVGMDGVEVDYSIFDFISRGIVVNEISLRQPVVRVQRDGDGWNVGRILKKREREADREGPGRSIALESIEVVDGTVTIDDRHAADGYRLPERIEGLNVRGAFSYEPVHYTVDVEHLGFRASGPDFGLENVAGTVAVRDDNLHLENVAIKLTHTSLTIDGVIEQYLSTPIVRLTTTGNVSLPEIARVVPAAADYPLTPRVNIRAEGPADKLVMDLDVASDAGNVTGVVTTDVHAPDFAIRGDVAVQNLNLAPILKDPAQRSDITGDAKVDLRIASSPANAPFMDRLSGTFAFDGPRVEAAGYRAQHVTATGGFEGSRINIDGRAAAYGGTATARGFIVPPAVGRPLRFDLQGSAEDLDLRGLPASVGAPDLATDLSVAEYQVRGDGRTIAGSARLNASTVEGAALAPGTTAEFNMTPAAISYTARGTVSDLNLQRIGQALEIDAIADDAYASRLNGDFDVTGSVPRTTGTRRRGEAPPSALKTMTLTANGTFRDSDLFGGRLPQLTFAANIEGGALEVDADGQFEGFNPARFAARPEAEGRVTGSLDVKVAIADVTAPITPEAVRADGTVTLSGSEVGGLRMDAALVRGSYNGVSGDIAELRIEGPELKIEASGPIALDREGQSALKYAVEINDVAAVAKLAGQEGIAGIANLTGTVTGNASSLGINGSLSAADVVYQENTALSLDTKYTVTVPDLQFAQARVEAGTTAAFVKVGGLEINSVNATATYENERVDFQAHLRQESREFEAGGQVILHPDHQEIHLPSLVVRAEGVAWRVAPGTEAAIQYGGGEVAIKQLHLVSADQSLKVSGTVALGEADSGQQPTGNLQVEAENVDLQQLQTILLQDRGLSGRLSANATVSGTTAEPVVDGRVTIVDGGFQQYRYQSLEATVDYQADRIGLDATLQQSPTESFSATGTIPMSLFRPSPGEHAEPAAGDEVDLHITSSAIALGFVQGFTTQVANVTGTLQADVRVTGSGADPHLEGHVDIRDGSFGVPVAGVTYTGLNTRIMLSPDRVQLQEFEIRDEEGKALRVAGELAVHAKKVGAVNITIDADDFELIDNELGDVGVDTALRITGELRRPIVEGDVRVHRGRLEVDRILQLFYDPYAIEELPAVVSAEQTVQGMGTAEEATRAALARARQSAALAGAEEARAGVDEPPAGGVMSPLTLNVRVAIPDNLVLRGSELRPGGPMGASLGNINITVGGSIEVLKKPDDQIRLVGVVNTVRGMYEFQGRRFELQRDGTVRFTGAEVIDPLLDVTAVRMIPNTGVEARIRITGTPSAPELTLSSTPALPESDILSLIVFNRQVNELGSGERSSLAATAGGIATGFIAAPLGESIGRALDLDLFEITTTTESGELGAGVTLGQQIGDRTFIKLRQQFGQRSLSEFILEYQLADFLRLRATGAPESTGAGNRINQRRVERGGIDLIFFFSY